MLWASDALGRDGKPAVLLLGATRTSVSVTAELAYVAAGLPPGPLPGRYYRSEGADPEPVTLTWPAGWPAVGLTNKLHPRVDTPAAALTDEGDETRIRLAIHGRGPVSNEQDQEQEGE